MSHYFISDLHLSENRPDITALFTEFLSGLDDSCESLYILGDFFSYWIGDDDQSEWLIPIKFALKQLAERNIHAYFMVGNRDFAVGDDFCNETKMTLLADPCVVEFNGDRILLMHGDLLCIDDVSYQRYRKIIRHPIVLSILRSLPLKWRMKIADKLRQASKEKQQELDMSMMDADKDTVADYMDSYQVDFMIHGHTHRPKIHHQARNPNRGKRIVLGDWYTQGSILELNEDGFSLFSLPLIKL